MIQINLLPDVKLKFLRAQRNKRLVIGLSFIVSGTFIAITVILALHVYVNQALHASSLQRDIDEGITEFQSIDNLETVLTVREQLLDLSGLHNDKPAVTRLPDFLAAIVPKDIKLAELTLDFSGNTIRLSGKGKDVVTVNIFADVLKNAYYSQGDGNLPQKAFSNVEFEISVANDEGVGFETAMEFDSRIFDIKTDNVEITIPSVISTQSSLRSNALFDAPVQEETE
jgi:hypothetical protein